MNVLALIRWVSEAFSRVLSWFEGERLRTLGRLEGDQAAILKSNEDLRKAADIDAAPIERDADRLLDGLREPRTPT